MATPVTSNLCGKSQVAKYGGDCHRRRLLKECSNLPAQLRRSGKYLGDLGPASVKNPGLGHRAGWPGLPQLRCGARNDRWRQDCLLPAHRCQRDKGDAETMTAALKRRLDKLVTQLGLDDGKPIVTYRMEPEHWARIKWNRNIQVILWHPDKNDDDRIERLADIERLKKAVNRLCLISQGDGHAIWENGKCIKDGGLGC